MTPDRPLRILLFTTLFPNDAQPSHGVFVENRLRHLIASGAVEARVVAPVPWFPSRHPAFGRWSEAARVPKRERRHGIDIAHPRFPAIPKLGMTLAPRLLYHGVRGLLRDIQREWDFDLIDAHYFYPDGVAAAALARDLGKPFLITARGTDINLIPEFAGPRRQIQQAAASADALVTVCAALKDALVDLAVPAGKVTVLRNGVDLDQFRPGDRIAARRQWGLSGTVLLSVGQLIERKGHHLVIEALQGLPGATLVIAGDGPERASLQRQADRIGVGDRVRLLGSIAHADLPPLYAAADALVLASSREGWANVLLEAMACGTPVVATDVWGTREVVATPAAGRLVSERSSDALRDAIARLLADPPDRSETRRTAESYSWDATTQGQLALFRRILADSDR